MDVCCVRPLQQHSALTSEHVTCQFLAWHRRTTPTQMLAYPDVAEEGNTSGSVVCKDCQGEHSHSRRDGVGPVVDRVEGQLHLRAVAERGSNQK